MQDQEEKYWDETKLAEVLRMSVGTVRNRYSQGLAMPPYIQLPGSRVRLWKGEAVHAWLDSQMVQAEPAKRRGRPPNSALVKRAAKAVQGGAGPVKRPTPRQRRMNDPSAGPAERAFGR